MQPFEQWGGGGVMWTRTFIEDRQKRNPKIFCAIFRSAFTDIYLQFFCSASVCVCVCEGEPACVCAYMFSHAGK